MLNKALLLAAQEKNSNTTTGKFTIVNGIALGELDPDFPMEQAEMYGFIVGSMGQCLPAVDFNGFPVTGLYYESNMMMGDRALVLFDIDSLGDKEPPDYFYALVLIDHTEGETFIMNYVGYDGKFFVDVPVGRFKPGSERVWEIAIQ